MAIVKIYVATSRNESLIIIIISIFKEDNIFSIIASLPYGPPVNTNIHYYQTFFGHLFFCKCCNVKPCTHD